MRLTSGSGETLTLSQQGAGQLTLELRAARTSIHLEQTKEKCKLRIKAGADSIAVTRKSFIEVFQAHPVEVKRRFIAFLESHIGKAPFLEAPVAPPGKVVARLRDGAELVGELAAAELRLQTAYGPLVIPRGELVQVFFPGSELGGEEARDVPAPDPVERLEVLVVARRFSPKGRLEAADFLLTTPYGELRLAAADVLHLGFGPEVPAEKPAEKDGKAGAP
ncbi:MAG: hypothetical protein HY721_15460 [Planctomycetes bacterium]|nr:hypothetical protein [Planctomycetota bacterium]